MKQKLQIPGLLGGQRAKRKLTHRQMLLVVQSKRRERADLARLCELPWERIAARSLAEQGVIIPLPSDEELKKFMFRRYHVPLRLEGLIRAIAKANNDTPPDWLCEAASYYVALERTHLEMVLSLTTKPTDNQYAGCCWERPCDVQGVAKLPKLSPEWFLHPPGDLSYWDKRFEVWQNAVWSSAIYSRTSVCRDLTNPDVNAKAAFLGAVFHKHQIPGWPTGELLESILALGEGAMETFLGNLQHSPEPDNRTNFPAIDSWLIEIWPLVEERKWSYEHLAKVAGTKFSKLKRSTTQASKAAVESRCEKLNLRLHPFLRRGGRPSIKESRIDVRGPFELMALWINGTGQRTKYSWMLGQRDLPVK